MSYAVRACSPFTRLTMTQIHVRHMSVLRTGQRVVIYRPEITTLAREAMALNSTQINEMDTPALRQYSQALEQYDDILWRHKNIFSAIVDETNSADKEIFRQERDSTEAIRAHVRKKQQEIKDRLPNESCCIL